MLNKIALSLKFLIKHGRYAIDFSIQHELQQIFSTLLKLTSEMALTYRAKISSMPRKTASIDFFGVFGRTVDQFYRQKESIADTMWNFALKQTRAESSVNVSIIREWLEPGDNVLKLLASDKFAAKAERAEFTCEWFQSHLLDFVRSSDQTLSIMGPTGSGKTVLASWVEERLQRPLAKRPHETIEYRFESDLPTEATSLACVKSLLLQMLQQNVGNVQLFTALVAAYKSFISSGDTAQLENSLWHAFEEGLKGYKNDKTHLIIVIDGLEKMKESHPPAPGLAERIHGLADKHTYVRTILLSSMKHTNGFRHVKEVELTVARTHDDVRRVVYETLRKSHHFNDLNGEKQADVQEQIADRANGSFLWAKLVAKSMILEKTPNGFFQVADKAPKNLHGLFEQLMAQVHLKQAEVKRLLGWMLVAQRPLTIFELSDLLRCDTQHHILSDKKSDVRRFIRESFGLLLDVQSHTVRFYHGALSAFVGDLLKKEKESLLSLHNAQNDLLLRLLLYSKTCFAEGEPSFEKLSGKDVDEFCHKHSLLEYSITYWIIHFKKTSMYHETKFELSPELKAVFPSSVQMLLCEWSRWTASKSIRGSLDLHNLCLRLRKEVFGENHVTVLQTLVILGNTYNECHYFHEATDLTFQASRIAIEIQYHSFALKCSATFLTSTELITDVTRTEIIIRRESILKYVIAQYKHQQESELVIQYAKVLIQLYDQIQEEKSAERVYQELHEYIVKCYGRHSDEITEIENFRVVLKKGRKSQEITPWEGGSLFEIYEEGIEAVDITQIEIIIRRAESYESRGDIFSAEEVLVSLWRRMVELCQARATIEHQIARFDCAIAYAKFLQRIKRREEATAILICLWAEYESAAFDSEVLVLRLKVVGELMKSFGLLSVAISVFKKVWGWFKQSEKITHSEAQSTTILISETLEEVTTRETTKEFTSETTVTSTVKSTVTEESRSMIQEIYKSQISSCKSSKEWKSIIKSCNALVTVYYKEDRWQEAIAAITATLEIVWSVVLTGIGMIALPETCAHEAILIATRLAQCYTEEHRFEESEKIYIRVYQACLFSLHVEDEKVTKAFDLVVAFYERHHRHEKTIEIYSDIIACYKRQLGASHSRTIKMLYTLGGLLRRYGYTRCYEVYLEIVTVLNKSSRVCHADAFEAAFVLMKYYQSEKRWADTRSICEVMWTAFVHHHHERKFELEVIEFIYATYSAVLELHLKAEFAVQRQVAIEYKETCSKYFGASSSITIEASIAYASVCERHEKYEHEALSVYEEVIKKTSSMTKTASTTITTSTSTSILQRVKTKLTKLYVKTITSSKKTVSTTEVERAISLSVERYSETKISLGCWHETTISHLHAVLVLYRKLNTKEANAKVVHMLRDSIYEVISAEASSWRLYNASIAIANIFSELELSSEGFELLQELHGLVIGNERILNDRNNPSFGHHHGKVTYIFLVAFELKLRRAIKISYSEIMISLITENMLFESFKRVTESKAKIEIVLVHGARLRQFLYTHKRQLQCQNVEKRVFEIFLQTYKASIKTKDPVTFTFFIALLEEVSKSDKDVNVTRAACVSGVNRVRILLESGEFQRAYDVAYAVYHFTSAHGAYYDTKNVGWGLKLCQYLAGETIRKTLEEKLRHEMIELSRTAIKDILDCCRESGLQFVRLPRENLEELVALLGRQHNHWYLEVSDFLGAWLSFLTDLNSSYSSNSGPHAKPRRSGPKTSSLALAAASSMPDSLTVIPARPSRSVRTSLTISAAQEGRPIQLRSSSTNCSPK